MIEGVNIQNKYAHRQLKLKSKACPICATGLDVKHTVSSLSVVIYVIEYYLFEIY